MSLPQEPLRQPEIIRRLALGLVSTRVRMRALLELLEEKGVLATGEFDGRAEAAWQRDYDVLVHEVLAAPAEEEPDVPAARQTVPPPGRLTEGTLRNLIDDAVAARVRMRALLELLEEKTVLRPGEFEARADAVWDRDYAELVREFYKLDF